VIVRAINIRQPWASMITSLPTEVRKDVENRSWRLRADDGSPYLGLLVLVASARCSLEEHKGACEWAHEHADVPEELLPRYGSLPLGGIVGVTRITGYIDPDTEETYAWHQPGHVGWELDGSIALPFRPYRGRQGPFTVELTPAEADALRAAKLAA